MQGFLGTNAPIGSDLSLLFVFTFAAAAVFGGMQARKMNFSQHCPVMAVAALLNWIPVLLLMLPNWVSLFTGTFLESRTAGISVEGVTPLLHGLLGMVAQILMTYTVIRMVWVKSLPPEQPIWLMRVTIAFWVLAAVGGIYTYMSTYALV